MNELNELLQEAMPNDAYEESVLHGIAEKIVAGKLADVTENEIFLLQTEVEIATQINRVDAIFNRLTNGKEEMTDDTDN
jgi:hypothetical protein